VGNATPSDEPLTSEAKLDADVRRMTRRSFTTGAIAALAGGSAATWLATRATEDGALWPLRRVLEFNERVAQSFYSPTRLAPEYAVDQAAEPRVNGRVGLESPLSGADWSLRVIGQRDRQIPLSALKQLPAQEMTTELKCVEGWSRIVHWKGVRLADFLDKFTVPTEYVGLSTPPDGKDANGDVDRYYVGLDRPSALHPQTLLCYEMNGQPLSEAHGAPLRLISAVKYGYKCIKRIGVVELTDRRPADYWAQRGYDWYAGH
jgi:DMSO/TMAO reductase YedYZ molybdopterin-dependent catalytic subunit